MTSRFLHISFDCADGDPRIKEFSPIFDKALDWFRYNNYCWILWTSSPPQKWYERIKPLLARGDHVFIVALDISERQGWMSKSFWEWLKQER